MAMDDEKEGVGYVPDEDEVDADEAKAGEKGLHGDGGPKKKSVAKRAHHRAVDPEDALKAVIAEREEFKDKYLRGLAEMDNFRKRMKKEREDFQKYVLTEFLLDLLQIYDNLERALKAKTSELDKGIVSGVEMIRKQFLDLLKKNQVLEIDALGRHFDPALHEALSKEEREGISKPVVVEVYQKGFIYNDKLLRPALTKVAVPAAKAQAADAAPNP
ncbi:MAG: nucleotide exchange factor GrpE [Acidobacteria bacterium]|jgi:molecular chaperone GrpE|nr:nucleotide exchange factor GrpE [Acidobacteriota bacterium]